MIIVRKEVRRNMMVAATFALMLLFPGGEISAQSFSEMFSDEWATLEVSETSSESHSDSYSEISCSGTECDSESEQSDEAVAVYAESSSASSASGTTSAGSLESIDFEMGDLYEHLDEMLTLPVDICENCEDLDFAERVESVLSDIDLDGENVELMLENMEQAQEHVYSKIDDAEELHAEMEAQIHALEDLIADINTSSDLSSAQEQVYNAPRALIMAEPMMGDMGPVVSRIANDYDGSLDRITEVKADMGERSDFKKFFVGSDKTAVSTLAAEAALNEGRVRDLSKLMDVWDGNEEIKVILEEQIENMEQEQIRLQNVVDEERESKGVFGFLFGWL